MLGDVRYDVARLLISKSSWQDWVRLVSVRSGNVWLGMIYFDLRWFGTVMCGSVRQYTARLFFQKHHGNVRYGGFCLGGFKLGWVRRSAARLFFQKHRGKV